MHLLHCDMMSGKAVAARVNLVAESGGLIENDWPVSSSFRGCEATRLKLNGLHYLGFCLCSENVLEGHGWAIGSLMWCLVSIFSLSSRFHIGLYLWDNSGLHCSPIQYGWHFWYYETSKWQFDWLKTDCESERRLPASSSLLSKKLLPCFPPSKSSRLLHSH